VQKHLDFIIEIAKSAILALFFSVLVLFILSFLSIPFNILMELLKIEIIIDNQDVILGKIAYLIAFIYLVIIDYNNIYKWCLKRCISF